MTSNRSLGVVLDMHSLRGPRSRDGSTAFDKWNYVDPKELAGTKNGLVSHEGDFIRTMENFPPYYQPLIPWVNKLRIVVFPYGGRWKIEDTGLYSRIKELLHEAWQDCEKD